jgi:hypothetical protein
MAGFGQFCVATEEECDRMILLPRSPLTYWT